MLCLGYLCVLILFFLKTNKITMINIGQIKQGANAFVSNCVNYFIICIENGLNKQFGN
jgi:hypothetical protein